jgi:hypothetical protein
MQQAEAARASVPLEGVQEREGMSKARVQKIYLQLCPICSAVVHLLSANQLCAECHAKAMQAVRILTSPILKAYVAVEKNDD